MNDCSEEAARWFAASRRGPMLCDERAAYDAWRSIPENAACLAKLQAIWNQLDPAKSSSTEIVVPVGTSGYRRQLAAVVGFTVLAATILPKFDNVWWNSLDWWSR